MAKAFVGSNPTPRTMEHLTVPVSGFFWHFTPRESRACFLFLPTAGVWLAGVCFWLVCWFWVWIRVFGAAEKP